jgi:hypothetical protein
MRGARRSVHVALIVLCSWPMVHAQVPSKLLPTPPVPSKSLPVVQGSARVIRSWAAPGVNTVVLRAENASKAEITTARGARAITASGIPQGGTAGYHPADPNWRETPASQWGLGFQAATFGPTMVISTSKELSYIHHHYYLDQIRLTVPEGVRVIKENRTLTGQTDPPPDLSKPAP